MNCVFRKSEFFVLAILMGAMICSVNAAAGDILYTTLGPGGAYDGSNGYFVDGSNYYNTVMANSFSLGAGATVADAVLALGNYMGNNNPVTLYVESNNGGVPGSIIATLSQSGTILPWGNGSGGGLVTFNCSGAQCALPAGSYWLVAWEPDPNTQQVWDYAYQDQLGNLAFNSFGSPTGPWTQAFDIENAFQIDSVPEPATLLVLIPGLLGAGYGLRRKLLS
jgi:PEP-CTERM motif-containing protein